MQKISIFGSGNGGVTAAYHLSYMGNQVCLCDFQSFDKQINAIQQNGGIEAVCSEHGYDMLISGFQKNIKTTFNIREAVEFSKVLMLICPSFAQEMFFKKMIPFLQDGSIVISLTANYASLVFTKMLIDANKQNLDICFVDTNTLPWACRLSEKAGATCISGIKKCIPCSIFPKYKDTDGHVTATLKEVFPMPIYKLDNPLVAGLENINIGGHPLYSTVNMGLLENLEGKVNYYKDCCSPATSRAQDKLDLERQAVGKAFGLNLMTDIDMVNMLYGTNEKTSFDFNKHSIAHEKISSGPSSSMHRYITEDIPYSMVPMNEFAKVADVDDPICNCTIILGSAYNDTDYYKEGRTLKRMGLEGMTKEEIIKFVSI